MIALLTATLTVSHSIVNLQPSSTTVAPSSLLESHSITSSFQQHEPFNTADTLQSYATAIPFASDFAQPAAVVIPAPSAVTPMAGPLLKRQGIWREPYTTSYDTPGCHPVTLAPGTFHFGDTTIVIPPSVATETAAPIVFHPLCLHGRPVLGIASHNNTELPSVIPNAETEWKNWIADGGRFATSIVPLMYSIAASSAMCWLLTFIIMGFQTRRPVLYRLSLLCCSVYLLVVIINFTNVFNDQFSRGYFDAIEARHIVKLKPKLHGLNLAFNTIIYLAQVQVAMSLFSRQKEKRMVLWLGGSVSIVAQTIYGISVFHPMSMLTSLSTFAYLFQIALGVLYSCCVFYYAITNWQSSLTRDPSMLFLTILALLAAMSPIILFIVDLVNLWIFEWADALSWVTSMLAIVTVREWADRVHVAERIREKNGVLGRQVFEDETGPAAIRPTTKPRRPSVGNNDDDGDNVLANRGRPWDEESELTGSTYHQQSPSTAHRSSPLLHHQRTSPLQSRIPASLSGPVITHAIIDSPFDPYENKSFFVQYFHKALDSIIFISDIVINLGMSVSRPLSFASTHNNTQTNGTRTADLQEGTVNDTAITTLSNNNNINNNNNNNTNMSTFNTTNIENAVTIVSTHNTANSDGSTHQQPLQQFHYALKRVVRNNDNTSSNNHSHSEQ